MNMCEKSGIWERVTMLLHSLSQSVRANVTLNTAICACRHHGAWQEAWSSLSRGELTSDLIGFNAAIDGSRLTGTWRQAQAYGPWKSMLGDINGFEHSPHVWPKMAHNCQRYSTASMHGTHINTDAPAHQL